MQAGLLRDIVAIEKATVTKNPNSGEENLTWVQIWRGRARVEFSSGTQLLENNETWNTITRKVTIRTKPVFTEPLSKLRMVIDSKYYRLLSMDVERKTREVKNPVWARQEADFTRYNRFE